MAMLMCPFASKAYFLEGKDALCFFPLKIVLVSHWSVLVMQSPRVICFFGVLPICLKHLFLLIPRYKLYQLQVRCSEITHSLLKIFSI